MVWGLFEFYSIFVDLWFGVCLNFIFVDLWFGVCLNFVFVDLWVIGCFNFSVCWGGLAGCINNGRMGILERNVCYSKMCFVYKMYLKKC